MRTIGRIFLARRFWRFFRRSPFLLQLALAAVGFRYLRRVAFRRLR